MKVNTEKLLICLADASKTLSRLDPNKYGALVIVLSAAKSEIEKLSNDNQSLRALMRKRNRQHSARKVTLTALAKKKELPND